MALDAKFKKNIDEYSEKISTIKSFVEAVRKMPGMYIGTIGDAGFLNMYREIFQNSVDQLIDPNSPCNYISVQYDMRDYSFTIFDNGMGIPFNDMVRVFTEEHTSKNYEKRPYEYSAGMHGVGAKVVNALSSVFQCTSYKYDGTAMFLELIEGEPREGHPIAVENKDKIQGTKIYFRPSTTIMGKVSLYSDTVLDLTRKILALNSIGTAIDFTIILPNGEVIFEKMKNDSGILALLSENVKKPLINPIYIFSDNGYNRLELGIVYDTISDNNMSFVESVISFCNMCPTIGGTHVNGVLEGIYSWFLDYMNNIYLNSSKSKIKIKQADIRNGLNIIINSASLNAIFSGQAKEILANDDMKIFAKEVTINGISEWAASNGSDLEKLCKLFKEYAEIRIKSESEKVKVTNKFEASALTGMPAKYTKPEGKPSDKLELIICEGDSAAGSVKDGRCKIRQGVFPIRGKIINAFKEPPNRVFNNEEVQSIIKILFNRSYHRGLTAEECKWDKIIIMADADPDGDHIATLLMKFFLMYLPQLIIAGKLYKAVPPLYGVQKSKNEYLYFREKENIIEYTQKQFSKKNDIKTLEGYKLTETQLKVLFNINANYVSELEKIAKYVHPQLLEMVLMHKLLGFNNKDILKEVKRQYRFINGEIGNNGDLLLTGIIGQYHNTLLIDDRLMNQCINVINILNQNNLVYHYYLNNTTVSLYELMKVFESFNPSDITRFKGLGEMDYDKLSESTLHPDTDRILIKYTIDDIKRDIEKIYSYENQKDLLLKGIKINKITNYNGKGKNVMM